MKTLGQLIAELEKEMVLISYKQSTLKYYQSQWKQIQKFFHSKNESYFTEALGMAFLEEKHNYSHKMKENTLTQSNIYALRVIRMLGDFNAHGVILRRYANSLNQLTNDLFRNIISDFHSYCVANQYSRATIEHYTKQAKNFLIYCEAHQIKSFTDLSVKILLDYIKILKGYSYKTIELALVGLRRFFRFLYLEKYTTEDFSGHVPTLKARKHHRIPSTWNRDELQKIIAAIDRGNPAGKRDYAIILIDARLGIRYMDIKKLKLSNINWTNNSIEFIQSKTGKFVKLPLLKDVGWAIIDYLESGRPKSNCEFIFLCHLAPIEGFSDNDHLYQIIQKYMKLAKVPLSPKKKVGMHSLRHSLATYMLESGTDINVISSSLGHDGLDATSVYLKSSIEMLRECALDFKEEVENGED